MTARAKDENNNVRRQLVLVDRSGLHKGGPVKALTEGKNSSGGRNNLGRRTARWRGGGAKKSYRIIDFKRRKWDVPATVERLEYDPNRTAFIALIRYIDGEQAYIIAPQRVDVGDTVIAGENVEIKPGNALPLKSVPIGTIIHNIETKPFKGGRIARSAGSFAQLVGHADGYAQVKLSSGEVRLIPEDCMATIGAVSNPDNVNKALGKAGRYALKGWALQVRGVVTSPGERLQTVDQGKTSGGPHPVTPWGKKTRGPKTRKKKSIDRLIVRRRHAAKAREDAPPPTSHEIAGNVVDLTSRAQDIVADRVSHFVLTASEAQRMAKIAAQLRSELNADPLIQILRGPDPKP